MKVVALLSAMWAIGLLINQSFIWQSIGCLIDLLVNQHASCFDIWQSLALVGTNPSVNLQGCVVINLFFKGI
jgi:hypothetical protein